MTDHCMPYVRQTDCGLGVSPNHESPRQTRARIADDWLRVLTRATNDRVRRYTGDRITLGYSGQYDTLAWAERVADRPFIEQQTLSVTGLRAIRTCTNPNCNMMTLATADIEKPQSLSQTGYCAQPKIHTTGLVTIPS